jgi:uncharacterized membrane protein
LGLLIAVGVALIAYRAHALNLSGTIAAAVLGTVVFGLGGVGWALITLTSFFSSSRLSKLFAVRKESPGLNISGGHNVIPGRSLQMGDGWISFITLRGFVQVFTREHL